jgi:hypothetical protein
VPRPPRSTSDPSTAPASPTRRDVLRGTARLGLVAAAGGALAAPLASCTTGADPDGAPATPPGRWPGHVAGCVHLGVSFGPNHEPVLAETGPLTAARRFYQWDEQDRELADIALDHAAGRLPWVSFKPPLEERGGWRRIFLGDHDDELRERGRRYAGLDSPVVVTFHHEPHGDSTGTPDQFAKAWTHIHDVLDDETGLANVTFVPVIGEWLFNPRSTNPAPGRYVTGDVLDRAPFLGIDVYQNRTTQTYAERLPVVLDWLDDQGHPDLMIGIGETGASDTFGTVPADRWWTTSWEWVAANTDRVGVVCYFNSLLNNNAGADWLLSESPQKMAAFRRSATSAAACTA